MGKFSFLPLALLLATSTNAQIYEWFDEQGNRHFSDRKPAGVEYRELGAPADNLSSYASSAVGRPRPDADDDAAGGSSDTPNRRAMADTDLQDQEAICEEYLAEIDTIHDRLRAGYNEPTGNRLRAERSALRLAYRRDCN